MRGSDRQAVACAVGLQLVATWWLSGMTHRGLRLTLISGVLLVLALLARRLGRPRILTSMVALTVTLAASVGLMELVSPHTVVLCAHPNDLADAIGIYEVSQLQKLIDDETGGSFRPRSKSWIPTREHSLEEWWDAKVAPRLRVEGAYRWARRRIRDRAWDEFSARSPSANAPNDSATAYCPSQAEVEGEFEPWADSATEEERLGWQAQVAAITRIRETTEEHGARLVLIDLGFPRAFSRAIESLAQQLGVEYSNVGSDVLEAAQRGESVYLAGDGHWTPLGCRRIAAGLAEDLGD